MKTFQYQEPTAKLGKSIAPSLSDLSSSTSRGLVDRRDPADPLAGRAHAARVVEGVAVARAGARLADPAEEHAQHRVGVGVGADRGARVAADPLLVDDDRRRSGPPARPRPAARSAAGSSARTRASSRSAAAATRPRSCRTRSRTCPTRHAREDRDPPLGDVEVDVLEVVLAGAADDDRAMRVHARHCGRMRAVSGNAPRRATGLKVLAAAADNQG